MLNEKCVFFYTIFSGLVALCIFIYGYVPVFEPRLDTASFQNLPIEIDNFSVVPQNVYNSQHVEKLVVIVVESLSMNLLTDKNRRNLPHTMGLIGRGEACLVPCNMPPPSTTFQKIKTLATGTRSSFIESILTFGVDEVKIDSIFRQAKNHRLRLSLHGTETWTQLFPNFFYNSKIVDTSKIFNDYSEIDVNATKSLITDVNRNDWNWFLLHYSGLKHLELNPYSGFKVLAVKLRELDNIVKFIHAKLNSMKNNYMLLIIGDTGMGKLSKYSESHETPETIAPYIMIGTSCPAHSSSDKIMDEFDLAPTLAVLTGLPIPSSSYGCLNSALLNGISDDQLLYALHYNTARLMNLTVQMNVKYNKDHTFFWPASCALFRTAVIHHGRYLRTSNSYNKSQLRDTISTLYSKTAECLSESLNDFFNTSDVSIQYLAFILVLEAMIILMNRSNEIGASKKLNFIFISITNMMILTWVLATGMSKHGTSFINMTREKGFVIATVAVIMICNSYVMASQKNFLTRLFSSSDAVTEETDEKPIRTVSSKIECATFKREKTDSLTALLISGTIIHALSLLELSYIKWEKWVLFFSWASLCFFIICKRIKKLYQSGASESNPDILKKQQNVDQGSVISVVFSILIMHRAIMAYTTVEYWLAHGNNQTCASICLIFGLVLLVLTCNIYYEPFTSAVDKIMTQILLGLMCCSIYMSNAAHGNVILPYYPTSDGAFEIVMFWLTWSFIVGYGLGFCTIRTCYKGTSSARQLIATAITCWACFAALLTRSHKVLLIPVQMLFGQAMADVFKKQNQSFIISHVWLGHLFFHYQGYTYSVDSVDTATGLLFSQKLSSSIFGLLLVVNTFSAPVLSYLICVHGILDNNSRKRASQGISETNITFGWCRLFLMSVYLLGMLVHCHSEWYWSILSPKLLYEIVETFLIATAMIGVQIIGLFHDLSFNLRIPLAESN